MLTNNIDEQLLEQGISAAKSHRRAEAYQLLMSAVQADPGSERAWLWLSGVVETDGERRYCLERVLAINPGSVPAQRSLTQLPAGEAIAPGFGDAYAAAGDGAQLAPAASPAPAIEASMPAMPAVAVPAEAAAPPMAEAPLPPPDQIFLTHPNNAPFIYGASPRPVVLSGVTPGLLLILLLVIVGALAAGSIMLRDVAREIIFSRGNTPATGTVIDRDVSRGRRSTSYYVTYSYYDGRTVREQVSRGVYEQLPPGATVQVRYATANPSIAHIEGNNGLTWPVIGSLLSAVFVGGGAFGLMRAISSLGNDKRLRQSGRRLPGVLVRAKTHKGSKGKVSLEARYSFRSPTSGRQIEAKIQRPRKDLKDVPLPPPGTPVAVLYADDECYVVL